MEAKPKLIPRSVQLGAEAKFFGLEKGASDGSTAQITFDIPDGMSDTDLRTALWTEQERLELFVLAAARLKGAISKEVFEERKKSIKTNYDTLLKRNQPAPEQPGK